MLEAFLIQHKPNRQVLPLTPGRYLGVRYRVLFFLVQPVESIPQPLRLLLRGNRWDPQLIESQIPPVLQLVSQPHLKMQVLLPSPLIIKS